MSTTALLAAAAAGGTIGACPLLLALRYAATRIRDLTAQVADAEHTAGHDWLTGLPNRATFYAADPRQAVAFGLLDLDGFKPVNDTYGHDVGDLVLIEIADRLHDTLADRGMVARLGGDEFALMLTCLPAQVGAVLAELAAAINQPVEIHPGLYVTVSGSFGYCPAAGAADLSVVLARADAAMYRAKVNRATVAVYDPVIDDHATPTGGARLRDVPRRTHHHTAA